MTQDKLRNLMPCMQSRLPAVRLVHINFTALLYRLSRIISIANAPSKGKEFINHILYNNNHLFTKRFMLSLQRFLRVDSINMVTSLSVCHSQHFVLEGKPLIHLFLVRLSLLCAVMRYWTDVCVIHTISCMRK